MEHFGRIITKPSLTEGGDDCEGALATVSSSILRRNSQQTECCVRDTGDSRTALDYLWHSMPKPSPRGDRNAHSMLYGVLDHRPMG